MSLVGDSDGGFIRTGGQKARFSRSRSSAFGLLGAGVLFLKQVASEILGFEQTAKLVHRRFVRRQLAS